MESRAIDPVHRTFSMKQLTVALVVAVAAVSARPRYLVIPLEDVEFVGGPQAIPVYPMMQQVNNHRQARSAQDEEFNPRLVANRRSNLQPVILPDDLGDANGPPSAPSYFIGELNAAGIPSAGDSLASGSNSYNSPPQGSDYVDYGAYTGKKGSFGWYSDHPVLLKGHGYH